MIECRDLSYHVGEQALVKSVDLKLQEGEVLTILGPNGAGKSTLLKLLSGELRPTAGTVTLDGFDLGEFAPGILASRRAVVPQSSQLTFPFTVLEVVLLGVTVPGFSKGENEQVSEFALAVLSQVGLQHLAHRFYPSLSGGEKQRVQLARALCQLGYTVANEPGSQILLLDEATANLDIAHQNLVCEILSAHAAAGCSVVLVAHDLNLAAAISDRIALMKNGQIAALGPVEDVFQEALLTDIYECELQVEKTTNAPPTVRVVRESNPVH